MNRRTISVIVTLIVLFVSFSAIIMAGQGDKVEVMLKNGKIIYVPAKAAEKIVENGAGEIVVPVVTHMITLDPNTSTNDPYGYHVVEMNPAIPCEVEDGSSVTFTITALWSGDYIRVFINGTCLTTVVTASDCTATFTVENITEDIVIKFDK